MDLGTLFNRSKLGQFGTSELENYPPEGKRLFGAAISQVERYEHFLRLILRRYDTSSAEFMVLITRQHQHPLIVESEVDRISELSSQIQLDSESFYLFAKVLLDKARKIDRRLFQA
jgi:hypothetical protein